MSTYVFIAVVCSAVSAWNSSCQGTQIVRVENLNKKSCAAVLKSYRDNPKTVQANCVEQTK